MRAFTLIEVLIYLALYIVIMSGVLVGVYSLFESSDRNQTYAMLEEEGYYLIGKIDSVVAQASTIVTPHDEGPMLTVTIVDGSDVSFSLSGGSLFIQRNTHISERLNNSNVLLTDLVFTHTNTGGNYQVHESVRASFLLHATTSDGHALSRSFYTVRHMRI